MLPIFFEQRMGSILTKYGFQAGCYPPSPRELYSVTRCNVFASIQFIKAIKVKEIGMECPACKGLKIIHVRAVPGVHQQYDVECPVCDGTGELPGSAKLPNHCPACGEPVRAGETWCGRHKPAEQLE